MKNLSSHGLKVFKKWTKTILGLIVILAIGFGVRVYNLTTLPIFADEAIYIRWAQVMRAEATLRFLPLSDGKQPLFMWLVIPFFKFIKDPLFAGRFLSVLAGVGTVFAVFVISYLLFKNRKTALITAGIYSLVPFAVFFDRMALADSTLTVFGVLIFAFGFLLIKTLRLDTAMILGFLLGGALLTKSPALYFSLLLPTFVIFAKDKKDIVKYFLLLIPTYLIGYGIFNVLRLGPNFQMLALRNLDYVYPLNHILMSPLDPFKPFIDRTKEFYWIMGTGSLFVTWLVAYFVNYKTRLKELLILTAWFLCPIIASSEFSKTMTARYVFFSLPFFVIIAGSLFLVKSRKLKFVSYILFAVFIAQSLNYDYKLLLSPEKANLPRSERSGYLEEWTAGQGIREIAIYLKNEELKQPGKKIVVGTEGYFGTLPDGLQIYFDGVTNTNVIGVGLQLEEVPQSLIDSKKFGNKSYLVVNNERLHLDPELAGLSKVAEYPKAVRPDGSIQSLILFEITDETISKN